MKISSEDREARDAFKARIYKIFEETDTDRIPDSNKKVEQLYQEVLERFEDSLPIRKQVFAELAAYDRTPLKILEEIVNLKDSTIFYKASINPAITPGIITYIYENYGKKKTKNAAYTFNQLATHASTPRYVLEDILEKAEEKDTHSLSMLATNTSADSQLLQKVLDKSNKNRGVLQYIIRNPSTSSEIIENLYNSIRTEILNVKPSRENKDLVELAQAISRNKNTPDSILDELIPLKYLGGSFVLNPRVTLEMVKKVPLTHIDQTGIRALAKMPFMEEDNDLILQLLERYDSITSYELSRRKLAPIKFLIPLCNVSAFRGTQGVFFTKQIRNEILHNRRAEFDKLCNEQYGIITNELPETMIYDMFGWRDL
jgi:hypothetical protein